MSSPEDKAVSAGLMPSRVAALISIAFMGAIVLVDFVTPSNIILPIFYSVPLVLHIWVRNLRFLWGMALLILGLTFTCFFLRMDSLVPEVQHVALFNRAASAVVTLLFAAQIHQRIVSERAADTYRQTLKKQTSELERQSEVLRITEEASVRKMRFLAAVSHDIRTPANAINLMAEVIGRMASTPAMASQIPEMARKLRAHALSMVELVSDVLDIARYDSGKVDLQESEFPLGTVFEEECRQIQPLAQEKNLELRVQLPDYPIWVRTDRIKLARILSNLAGNAIKFTTTGMVQVGASLTADRQVLIRVSDTGEGIPADQLERIFDEFAQLRNRARDRTKGTGLGLAICKRLIEVMGGTITVESAMNRGSTFTVTLPSSCVVLRTPEPATRRDFAGHDVA